MKKSAFALMTSTVMILAACTQQKPGGEVVTYYPKPMDQYGAYIPQKEITLFDLGRTLSHNAVDLFDPAAPTFNIPPDDPKAANPLASFPAHPFMLIKDEDVTIFSLYTADMPDTDEFARVVDEVASSPIPLISGESQLPP